MSTVEIKPTPVYCILLATILFFSFSHQGFAQEAVTKTQYLDYARKAADWAWQNYDATIKRWKEGFDPDNVFGYRPPGGLLEMAVVYAYLNEKENKQ